MTSIPSRGTSPCVVPSCNHRTAYNKKLSWHYFPKKDPLRKLWIQALIQNTVLPESWEPKPKQRICGAMVQAAPEHSNATNGTKPRQLEDVNAKLTDECSRLREAVSSLHEKNAALQNVNVGLAQVNDDLRQRNQKLECRITELETAAELQGHELEKLHATLATAGEKFSKEQQELKSYVCDLEMKLERSSSTQKLSTRCTPARVLSDDEKLHFYTGFNGLERLKRFCSFVEAGYEDYKNACTESPSNRGRNRVFSVEEQLIIVLIRLRVGLLERDLASRYDVSLAYMSELCSFWTEFLSNYLEQTPIWPFRETVNDFMPEVFKESYPTTTVILDCTERFIETPSDLRVQSDTTRHISRITQQRVSSVLLQMGLLHL
ncbi:uncharacterized protein LOC135385399 [Ornithodoros turicata]|uniref:uncharacterized protein LOC135385399 n=1 Tax=Ornithodoros turicata TaxID=34597 RepID=UPI003139A4F1